MLRLIFAESGVLPQGLLPAIFVSLVVLELSVPPWSERKGRTNWHPRHIAERYGLFAIILLGEIILAASSEIERAMADRGVSAALVTIAVAGLVVIFALWWLYFLEPAGQGLARNRDRALLWGFGQYGVFAALASLGAGLEVAIEQTWNQIRLSSIAVSYAVAIPVGLFLVLVWAVSAPVVGRSVVRPIVILSGAAVILLVPLSAEVTGVDGVIGAIAAVCASMIAATILMGTTQDARRQTSGRLPTPTRPGSPH